MLLNSMCLQSPSGYLVNANTPKKINLEDVRIIEISAVIGAHSAINRQLSLLQNACSQEYSISI